MGTKFDDLCKKMGINSSPTSAEDLDKLINWCETTVSTDLHFEGSLEERFSSYQDLASGFLEMSSEIFSESFDGSSTCV